MVSKTAAEFNWQFSDTFKTCYIADIKDKKYYTICYRTIKVDYCTGYQDTYAPTDWKDWKDFQSKCQLIAREILDILCLSIHRVNLNVINLRKCFV